MKTKQLTIKEVNEVYIAKYLKGNEGRLKSYGGESVNIREFLRGAMLVIMDSFKLRNALTTERGKESLYNALKHAASIGLSLNPSKKESCLIPYDNKDGTVTIDYQIMKEGYIQLALNSGKVEYINSFTVYENDHIEMKKTLSGDDYVFKPAIKDRGKIVGFMAALKAIDGTGHIKYMTKTEVNEIRDKYSIMYQKNKENSPWTKSYEGMGLKTALKALFRSISISPDMKKAVKTDDYFEFEEVQERNITPGVTSEDVKRKIEKKKQPPKKTNDSSDQKQPEPPKGKDLF